jgi:hypothetical protein
MLPMAIWDPSQIATQNINGKSRGHEDCAYPETPVTMHTPPVRPWIGFASAVAISFWVVPISSHYFSKSDEHSQLSSALLPRARWYKDPLAAAKLIWRPIQPP